MEPAARECRVGVLRWRRHWQVRRRQRPEIFLVQPLLGGGNGVLVRLARDVSTLLGPEGTTEVVFSEP